MEAKKRIGIDGNFTRMLSILVFLLVFAGIQIPASLCC